MHIVTVKGTLSFPAETKTTTTGQEITSFKIGVRNSGKVENPKDQYENYTVKIWGQGGTKLVEKLVKGAKVTLMGNRSLRTYKDKAGAEKTIQELTVDSRNCEIDFTPPVAASPDMGGDDDFPGI